MNRCPKCREEKDDPLEPIKKFFVDWLYSFEVTVNQGICWDCFNEMLYAHSRMNIKEETRLEIEEWLDLQL